MKKYEFTGETKEIQVLYRNVILHRIKAVVAFGIVEVGEICGWIEKEENLSHEEKAWVYGNAEVWGSAKVYGNAEVCGDAESNRIKKDARLTGKTVATSWKEDE